jgi:hypothetical protein
MIAMKNGNKTVSADRHDHLLNSFNASPVNDRSTIICGVMVAGIIFAPSAICSRLSTHRWRVHLEVFPLERP